MELIERYVHQVGRFLPGRDREDIQDELRSLLLDKLETELEANPSGEPEDMVVALLEDLGYPRHVAASYSGERYLVGPELYPLLIQVLRIELVVYIIVNAVLLVFAAADMSLGGLLESALGATGNVMGYLGITVLVFALLERQDVKINPLEPEWDPRQLPAVDQPGRLDQVSLFVGVAFNLVFLSLAFYFWRMGGLPYVINWPAEANFVPVSRNLLFASGAVIALQIVTDLYVFLRRRWELSTSLIRTGLDVAGLFAVFGIIQEVLVAVPEMDTPLSHLIAASRYGVRGLLVLIVALTIFSGVKKAMQFVPTYWKLPSAEKHS